MNKTLLLILCDFLLLNLLALTRWEKAEPTRAKQPPVPEMAANAATKDQDLVEAMKLSLADEKAARDELAQRLSTAESATAAREQSLTAAQMEKAAAEAAQAKLAANLAQSQRTAKDLGNKVAAATQEASMTKEQLAQLQRELEEKRAEAERQKQALAALEQQQIEARQKIEGLTVAAKVAEREKGILQEQAETLKGQVEAERQERIKVQSTTAQLAQAVGDQAQKSGELTKEIRDNRPINANVMFSDFLANRVATKFTAVRAGLFSPATREKETATVLVTDGTQTYALLHIDDTPFPISENSYDWEKLTVSFAKPPAYSSAATSVMFLTIDPRVVAVPVTDAQVAALGVKVYKTAADPFKFPEAVLVNGGGKGYGEVAFKLDATEPGYVKVDNRLLKRLFGTFAPSRGDLVLSKTGELLGIMVNSDYCAVVGNFQPLARITTGDNVKSQRTGDLLNGLAAQVRAKPLKLQ